MPVYLPNAVIGNGRLLLTLGSSGEVMGLFYPSLDFAQNVHEGMLACFFPAADQPGTAAAQKGHFCWTFQPCWHREQRYTDAKSCAVETILTHSEPPLKLGLLDFVLPHRNVVVRQFSFAAPEAGAVLYQYLDLRLGELSEKNSLRYLRSQGAFVQYWRDIALAIAASELSQFQCGRVGNPGSDAKRDMEDGALGGNWQEIGDVNLALGWSLRETKSPLMLYLACGRCEATALFKLESVRRQDPEDLHQEVVRYWEALPRCLPQGLEREPELAEAFQRAVSSLYLLRDRRRGAFIAAPEFDPLFERSGGYGYCWPRDAAEAVLALAELGAHDQIEQFFLWCKQVQSASGHWQQRYWLSGEVAPAWCLEEGFRQVDQTASVVFAFCQWAQRLPAEQRLRVARRYWDMLRLACEELVRLTHETGLHRTACDLWESFAGSFTYTNGAIAAALREAALIARATDNLEAAARWEEASRRIKTTLLERLWCGNGFARGLTPAGELDKTPDSSVLGLVEPFAVLDLGIVEERTMAASTVSAISASLTQELPCGRALRRFEGDAYLGGICGAVNTLWLARAAFRLALAFAAGQASDLASAQQWFERGEQALRAVVRCRTATGLFPELIGTEAATPFWAAPHLWASAAFISACCLRQRALSGLGG